MWVSSIIFSFSFALPDYESEPHRTRVDQRSSRTICLIESSTQGDAKGSHAQRTLLRLRNQWQSDNNAKRAVLRGGGGDLP